MSSLKLALVDDDELALEALAIALRGFGHSVDLYGSAAALLSGDPERYDCVITDVRMEEIDGQELARRLRADHQHLPVLVMSSYADIPMAVSAMKVGAFDFVDKRGGSEAVRQALEALDLTRRSEHAEALYAREQVKRLTDRERHILAAVGRGQTSQQIAQRLGISPRTVDAHRRALMVKLAAERVGHLVRIATLAQLTDSQP